MPALGLAGPQCWGWGALSKLGSLDVHLLKLGSRDHRHRQARENSPEERSCPRPLAISWLECKPRTPGPRTGRSLVWSVVREGHCAQPCPGLAPAQAASWGGRDPCGPHPPGHSGVTTRGPRPAARLRNLVARAELQLAEVTQAPVVPRRRGLAPHLRTYRAVGQGEDAQGRGALLPAERQRENREALEEGLPRQGCKPLLDVRVSRVQPGLLPLTPPPRAAWAVTVGPGVQDPRPR